MKNRPVELDRPSDARIEWHGEESGTLTSDMIEERAREIARIEGRTVKQVSENDRDRARLELRDDALILSSYDARSDLLATHNPADPTVEIGHQVAPLLTDDEQTLSEKEVMEGIREAEHERMLSSREEEEEQDKRDE
jgi:hypothetical protein